jgi:hypothetical protein
MPHRFFLESRPFRLNGLGDATQAREKKYPKASHIPAIVASSQLAARPQTAGTQGKRAFGFFLRAHIP